MMDKQRGISKVLNNQLDIMSEYAKKELRLSIRLSLLLFLYLTQYIVTDIVL